MYCNQCGQENSNNARFCSGCGNKLEIQNIQTSHTPPQLEKTEPPQPRKKRVELWNPNATANWSLLFTPIFGSYLQMKNWEAMGNNLEAKKAKDWIFITVAFIFFMHLVAPFIWGVSEETTITYRGFGFLYVLYWYFDYAKKQAKFVKENIADNYQKKSWLYPLLIATPIFLIAFFILTILDLMINELL